MLAVAIASGDGGEMLHPGSEKKALMGAVTVGDGDRAACCKTLGPPDGHQIGQSSSVRGLVSLKIVAAQHLPLQKRLFRSTTSGAGHFDSVVHAANNSFVVISFGKQSCRTQVVPRTLNPVWREGAFLSVRDSEENYHIVFSVYDYGKLSYNSCIGSANIKVSRFLEHPNVQQKLVLALDTAGYLLIEGVFVPYDELRRRFWQVLARQYDHDDNGKLNRLELSAMLESVGSTLTEETIDRILQRLDVGVDGEIGIPSIVASLEEIAFRTSISYPIQESVIQIDNCPICGKGMRAGRGNADAVTHLAICNAKNSGHLDRLVMGGFLTEEYASRKWFMRLLSFMSFGGYRLGKNNGNIFVQDRRVLSQTGKLVEEKMPTYIRLGIRLLYQQAGSSRAVDSAMLRQIFQGLTIKQGKKFEDPSSARYIPEFVRFHKLDMEEVLDPIDTFRTFNEFFYRKLKPGARKLCSADPRVAVVPADSRLNVYQTTEQATVYWIKGENFTVANLLKDDVLGKEYEGGSLVISRLAPQDYHRFHSPVDGVLSYSYHISGAYLTVNPMAVRQKIDVFTENARTIVLIDSDHFGKVAMVAIGAMMVGSVHVTASGGQRVSRMDEIGYFAFGGSTVVLIFTRGSIDFDADLVANSRESLETLVRVGESLGRAHHKL